MKVDIGPYTDEDKNRKVRVQVEYYDTWNADHTLALIILPVLEKLQSTKHGSPLVSDEDIPSVLHHLDVHERWDFILNKMIWSFRAIIDELDDREDLDFELIARIRNEIQEGLDLFAKYYRNLWD